MTTGGPRGPATDLLIPAIEVGGGHVAAAHVDLADPRKPVVHPPRRADLEPTESAEQIIERIVACAAVVPAQPGSSWGVAVPGPFDYAGGLGLFKDVGKFDALYGVDLRARLSGRLPGAPADIVFVNDAEAFLWGEWLSGAARGHDRALGLTLGTGIGSAFLAHGAIVTTGALVPPEGSVHLLSVGGVPLEEAVSSRAIARRYAAAAGGPAVSVHEVARRAKSGERAARLVFDDTFRTLGEALAPWVSGFGASVIVVGGSIAQSWGLVEPALAAGVRGASAATTGPCVIPAEQPELSPLIGAAWQASRAAAAPPRSSAADSGRAP